jgi:hypothetical protein
VINRKTLAKFTDVCGKGFSNLPGNRERFLKYIQDAAGMG